jgi:cytochrome c556
MSRFALREFTIPSYANSIPPEDKEERPVQKIEKFATFLNEIPWFSKDEDGEPSNDESMLSGSTAGVTPDEMREDLNASMLEGKDPAEVAKFRANPAPLDQSVELQVMKNAGDDTDEFGRALEAAELKRNQLKAPDTDLFGKAELGKQLTDAPDPNDKDAVMAWQTKLNELGYNLDVDGIWGNQSKAAYKDWYSKKWGK